VASKTDEELVSVFDEWTHRVKDGMDEVAQQVVANNMTKISATIVDRKAARGLVARFYRQPVLADSHWTFFNSDGKAVGRVTLAAAAKGRLDRHVELAGKKVFLASWLQGEQYGRDLVTHAKRHGLEATLRFFVSAERYRVVYNDHTKKYGVFALEGHNPLREYDTQEQADQHADWLEEHHDDSRTGNEGVRAGKPTLSQGNRKPLSGDEHFHGVGSDSIRHEHGPYEKGHKHDYPDAKWGSPEFSMQDPAWRTGEGVQEQGLGEARGRKWVNASQTYKGYTITEHEDDAHPGFKVKPPNGSTWTDIATNVETAKKWIDQDIPEQRSRKEKYGPKVKANYVASEMVDHPTYWIVQKDGKLVEAFLSQEQAEELAEKFNGSGVKAASVYQPRTGAEHGAFVALVSAIADALDRDEEFQEIAENFPMSGMELTETIPGEFATANVDFKTYVDMLVPDAQEVIDAYDKALAGKTTMQQLADEFGDKVWTSAVLSAMGHGVSIDDEPGVSEKLKELGLDKVRPGIHKDDMGYDEAWQALTKYASQGD